MEIMAIKHNKLKSDILVGLNIIGFIYMSVLIVSIAKSGEFMTLIGVIIALGALLFTNIYQIINLKYTVSLLQFEAADFLKNQLQTLDLIKSIDEIDETALQAINKIFEKRYDLTPDDRKIVEEIKKMSINEEIDIKKINEKIQNLLSRKNTIEKEYDILINDIKKEKQKKEIKN